MEDLNYEGLQPESIGDELTWLEFFEALSEVVEESIRSPIRELETIRDIIEVSDPVIVANTIKQMGFDIPEDLIRHNIDRLARSIYMLPLFHETSGTTDFQKAVSFVLGRDVLVHDLYTKDYVQFYRRPYGALKIDGGEWYKATHVGISMEMLSSDVNLLVAEEQTVKDRLVEAFYEFAPVNLVMDSFSYLINMHGTISITGKMFMTPRKQITIGDGVCTRKLVIEAPDFVRESSKAMLRVGYSVCNAKITNIGLPTYFQAPAGVNTDAEISSITNIVELPDDSSPQRFSINIANGNYGYFMHPVQLGVSTFTEISVGVPGGWDGAAWPTDGSIGTSSGPIQITRTNENGVAHQWYLYRTDFPSLGQYTFDIEFQNPGVTTENIIGEDQFVPVYAVDWKCNKTSLVGFSSTGEATFGIVSKDTPVVVTATYKGLSATANIIIQAYNDDIVGIEIVGPSQVPSGEIAYYETVGVFNDGSRQPIDADITLVSHYAAIDGQKCFVAFPVEEDIDVFLNTEYTSRSGAHVVGVKKVRITYVDSSVYLVRLDTIITQVTPQSVGAQVANSQLRPDDELLEGDERRLKALATFSDGSVREVQPYWKSSSPSLHVATDGIATAGYTDGGLNVTVDATYQHKGVKAVSRKIVKVVKDEITLESLSIFGSSNVLELTRSQYTCIARWSDGSATSVSPEWSTNIFSINSDGVFEAGSVDKPKSVTITAKLEELTATLVVVVLDTPIVLQYITIIGPDNVTENIAAQYTAYVHFSDNTDVQISPEWGVVGNTPSVTIGSNGVLLFSGPVSESIIELKATYRVGLEKKEQTKSIVLVPETSIITTLSISGPTSVYSLDRVTLTAVAVYEDGSIEPVSPIWSVQSVDPVNEAEVMADIVSPGILQGRTVDVDTKVVVVARYFKETAEHLLIVKPRGNNQNIPKSSRIIGPPAFSVSSTGSYAQAVEFHNGCGEIFVSSDWSLDVGPEVAVIDSDGYVHSVNGAAVPVTITAVYQCGDYTITDELVIQLVADNKSLSQLLIHGPGNVLVGSYQQFSAEVFRQGEPIVSGQGEPILASDIDWEITGITQIPGSPITIEGGHLYVSPGVLDATSFNIVGTYREGFETATGKVIIKVTKLTPVYGIGPIGVSTDAAILTNLIEKLPDNAGGHTITLTLTAGNYGYFAHPASLGGASFLDTRLNTSGGWDGATRPFAGDTGTGPLTISRTINNIETIWFLYRTDHPALGNVSYVVTYN